MKEEEIRYFRKSNVFTEVQLVEELIKAEGVPTSNPKALATIMYLTASWGNGDAFAGLQLGRILEKETAQKSLIPFVKRTTGSAVRFVSKANLLLALEELAKKHKVFEALQEISLHGSMKKLHDLENNLELYSGEG